MQTTPILHSRSVGWTVSQVVQPSALTVMPTESRSMFPDTPSVTQLSHVISQAAAPAFLLGALAAFIAVLISRLNRIVDRTVILNGIPDDDTARCRLKADLPRLMQRAVMMNRAIFWAVIASIAVTLLVIVAFVTAFFQIQHERGVAIFFMISLGAFTISLVDFAREVRIALSEYDHHG
jgi:hypothetical protein